jgi:hypothetical protein
MHFCIATVVATLNLLIAHAVVDAFDPTLPDLPTTLLGVDLTKDFNGTCTTTDGFPTEEQYDIGAFEFCDEYVNAKSALQGGLHRIDAPIKATYDLKTYNQKLVKWMYRLTWAGPKEAGYMNNQECKVRFRSLYTSNRAGGLGTAYCVVKGTIADNVLGGIAGKGGMSGEGAVVILGGKLDGEGLGDHPHNEGWFSYEAYERPFNS